MNKQFRKTTALALVLGAAGLAVAGPIFASGPGDAEYNRIWQQPNLPGDVAAGEPTATWTDLGNAQASEPQLTYETLEPSYGNIPAQSVTAQPVAPVEQTLTDDYQPTAEAALGGYQPGEYEYGVATPTTPYTAQPYTTATTSGHADAVSAYGSYAPPIHQDFGKLHNYTSPFYGGSHCGHHKLSKCAPPPVYHAPPPVYQPPRVEYRDRPVYVERRVPVDRPVYVERKVDRPVYVERRVPVDRPIYVERKVIVNRPVYVPRPVPVDRPVYVERRVPVPVHIERRVPVDRPIYVNRPVPVPVHIERRVPVDRPVYVNRPVPVPVHVERRVPVDRPVYVERRVPVPVPRPYPVDRPVYVPKPVAVPVHVERRVPVPAPAPSFGGCIQAPAIAYDPCAGYGGDFGGGWGSVGYGGGHFGGWSHGRHFDRGVQDYAAQIAGLSAQIAEGENRGYLPPTIASSLRKKLTEASNELSKARRDDGSLAEEKSGKVAASLRELSTEFTEAQWRGQQGGFGVPFGPAVPFAGYGAPFGPAFGAPLGYGYPGDYYAGAPLGLPLGGGYGGFGNF